MNEFKRFEDRLTGLKLTAVTVRASATECRTGERLVSESAAPGDGTESPGRHTLRTTP